ncbi:MAG: polyprenyl synthetase family protein [Pseudomonadota bacterium]
MTFLVLTAPTVPANDLDGSTFLSAVASLRTLTNADLEQVNAAILENMSSSAAMIPDIANHLLKAGGKRIRPMLTIAAARALGYDGDNHVKLAAAVELIHGATLLHDDVVDESSLRRGSTTANVIWGNKESVLVGDFIFARAFEFMVSADDLRVLQILSRASSVIAEGEVLQLATQKNLDTTYDMYIDVVNAKTAALFQAATQVAGVIAGDMDSEAALAEFGQNFGLAYQLIDDALDYAGFEDNLGKSIGDDFREGKMTLPVVYAVARSQPDEKEFWRRTIADGRQHDDDLERACALMARDDAVIDTIACARRFAMRAASSLEKLPESVFRNALIDLVETSVARAA